MASTPLSVLFVDDQKSLLNAVERVVRRQAKGWNVYFSDSPQGAIKLLEENPIKVVVSDMRMPDMDGVQLLEYVKDKHPNVVRFILSGFSQNDRTLDAVKVAHQFFIKPFSTQDLIEALELTHTLYKRVRNPGLQGLIASIDRLPTPRKIYYDISKELSDPNTTIEKVATIVAQDTAIAGKILQVVNSAFFGQSCRVDSISQAVSILGIEAIRSLVLVAGIASDHKEILSGIISIDLYSKHCMEVAMIAKWISKKLKYPASEQETLFTVGLLHDIGKLILIKKYSELYIDNGWMEDPYATKLHISQIEKLGDYHAEIGAALIALWGLPPRIVNTIAFYKDSVSEFPKKNEFAVILHIADEVSNYLKSGSDIPFIEIESVNREMVETLPESDIEAWVEEIRINGYS